MTTGWLLLLVASSIYTKSLKDLGLWRVRCYTTIQVCGRRLYNLIVTGGYKTSLSQVNSNRSSTMYPFWKGTQQPTWFPLWISGTLRIWSYGIYRQQNSIQKFMLMFEFKHSFWVNKETFLCLTTSGQMRKSWPHNINLPIYTKYHQNKIYKF